MEQLAATDSAGASTPVLRCCRIPRLGHCAHARPLVIRLGRQFTASTCQWHSGTAESALKNGTWLRTLYVQPYALLTAAEHKVQAARTKTTPAKHREALPRDVDLEPPDSSFNPFPEWPRELSLRLTPDLQYKRVGRLLRSMLRWCKQYCTYLASVTNITYATRSAAADELFDQFTDAVAAGVHDRALLFALQAVAEALEQTKCIFVNKQKRTAEHSSSGMLTYIATRRLAQSNELCVFPELIAARITGQART
jgi:hypothetical protein